MSDTKNTCGNCMGYIPKCESRGQCWNPSNRPSEDSDLPVVNKDQKECYWFVERHVVV